MSLRRGLILLATIFLIMAGFSLIFVDHPLAIWLSNADVDQTKLNRIQRVLDVVTLKSVSAIVGPLILCGGWLALRRNNHALGRFLVGLGGNISITEYVIDLMKWLFGRLRPYQWLQTASDQSFWFSGGTSFPSGHAGYCAALGAAFAIRFPRRASIILPLPVFVAMQRVLTDKHFLSDVLTGIAIAMIATAIMAQSLRPPPQSIQM